MDTQEGLEAPHTGTPMTVAKVIGRVLGQEAMTEIIDITMMKEEVLDMKAITEVLLVLRLSVTGVEKTDLGMEGNLKIVLDLLMGTLNQKGDHLIVQGI